MSGALNAGIVNRHPPPPTTNRSMRSAQTGPTNHSSSPDRPFRDAPSGAVHEQQEVEATARLGEQKARRGRACGLAAARLLPACLLPRGLA